MRGGKGGEGYYSPLQHFTKTCSIKILLSPWVMTFGGIGRTILFFL